jgi:polyferredoxin
VTQAPLEAAADEKMGKMEKIIRVKHVVQCLFLAIALIGFHKEIGIYIFIFFPLAFISGNFFCGWVCPLGTVQELARTAGSGLAVKKMKLPANIQRYAQYSKYIIALAMIFFIAVGYMRADEANGLPFDAYQSFFAVLEGKTLGSAAVWFLAFVVLLSFSMDRPFCNYLCVNSIEYALPGSTRVFTIRRNQASCVKCRFCDKKCQMNIVVSEASEIRNLQCINCLRCIASCHAAGALSYDRSAFLKNMTDKISARK